jgi:hypothetical protein
MNMQQIKFAGWLVLALVALAGAGCSGSNGETFQTVTSAQTTIINGAATTLALTSNLESVTFPANCFSRNTIALISSDLAPAAAARDDDPYLTYYPTTTKAVTDLIAGVVINTPVDRLYHGNVDVKLFFYDGFSRIPGDQYLVYRFDFNDLVWDRWGAVVATVDPGGATASFTLPTAGFRGFIGSLALFKGLQPGTSPAYTPTTLTGTVYDESGGPLSTDIGLYYYVGTVQYPVDLPAGSGAHVPAGGPYRNTFSSVADGTFSITLPDYMIGQALNIEFGREDDTRLAQPNFNIVSPQYSNYVGQVFTNVPVVTLGYGVNVVQSQPVRAGASAEQAIQLPNGVD